MYADTSNSPRSPVFPLDDHLSTEGPLPNPPFVFPARPASTPSSFSRAGRRPHSAYELPNQSGLNKDFQLGAGRSAPPPLPSFSFNQTTAANQDSGIYSPPLSPMSATGGRPIPSRPAGHRRGGSEFIGGDGKTGAGSLLSTSPTKTEGHLPPPNPTPSSGPPAGRRGHAHRRSAAISCHDLSAIMKPQMPAAAPLGGSAPTSPSEAQSDAALANSLDNAIQSGLENAKPSDEVTTPPIPTTAPARLPKTTRVGFSDNIEFIPRPLSLVSSDASSTMTVRQGHSATGSLSSVISLSAASPPSKEQQRGIPGPTTSRKPDEHRPSTAGPVLGASSQGYFSGEAGAIKRRSSDPSMSEDANGEELPLTPRTAAKRYFFFNQHDEPLNDVSPNQSRPVSASSSEKTREKSSGSAASPPRKLEPAHKEADPMEGMPKVTRKTSMTRKPSKKQKKVKSWAGSILSRKGKPRSSKHKGLSRKSPTPPLRNYEPPTYETTEYDLPPQAETPEQTTDEVATQQAPSTARTDFANWRPRHVAPQDDDTMSPIIDLDAALGPFNTPTGHDLEWESSQKSFGQTKRRMHSAAGMTGFKGPGLHYHRRTESAPEMVAFENPRFGLHHIGSSSTMEDVFEEDEEDEDWEEVKTVSHKGSTIKAEDEESAGLGIEIKVVDAESGHDNVMDWTLDEASNSQRGLKRKTSALSEGEGLQTAPSMNSARSVSPLRETFTMDDLNPPPRIGDDTIITRPISSSKSSSTSTPPFRAVAAKDLAPMDIQPYSIQPPYLTPTTPNSTFQSPFPSPRTPISYDARRMSTAPSSILDEPGFNPLWLGEPGPEIRMSVDEVPSLTSSNSTMTRESMMNPGFGNPQFRNGQRSASLSNPTVNRKRSSIASLSRLLSSHGEKSKLNIEESADDFPESKKESKGKRISRMMQFWKPSKAESPEA
ncbi:hypothetical protein O988_07965 [Pseudogymnoascus sp. VKM F-3808]|nr:hypothetical protein O988_07965 [Pseudogymnoascus sp. VKM F-3808]